MKTLFRVLGAAAAVAVTGAAIVVLDKVLNDKDPLHVENVEFPRKLKRTPPRPKRLPKPTPRARPRRPLPVTHGPLPLKRLLPSPRLRPQHRWWKLPGQRRLPRKSLRQRKRP